MDIIVAIYNKLDENSPYRSDIFDLFGTQDGMITGVIGNKAGGKFKSLEWDWGLNGFKKICKFLYWKDHKNLNGFEVWYEESKASEFINLIDKIDRLLYVFNYKGLKISSFVAKVEKIQKREGRLWFKFIPVKFVLLPPDFMRNYHDSFFSGGREDPIKWNRYYEKKSTFGKQDEAFKNIFSSAASLDQYHLIPVKFLEHWVENMAEPSQGTKPIFVATIEDNEKLLRKRLNTNNQIFWSIFSQYIGRSQIKGSFYIVEKGKTYSVTDIPVNSFNEKGFVYNHEVGTPYVIFQVLNDIYQQHAMELGVTNRFIDEEFTRLDRDEISISKSIFLKRSEKVSDIVKNYRKEYAATDYDYVLDLEKIGIKKTILFDLTSGLWYKGIGKSKTEFVDQWIHNIVEVPKNNQRVITFWHYGLERYEVFKGQEIGKYLIEKSGLNEDQYLYLNRTENIEIPNNLKVIFLPFYDDNQDYYELKKELLFLDPKLDKRKYKQSLLYRSFRELLQHLIVSEQADIEYRTE